MSDVTTISTVRYTLWRNGGLVKTLTRGAGPGVAAGGSVGQVLVKSGAANYATAWASQSTLAAGTAATLATPRNIDGQAFDGSGDITVVAPATHAATSKATPVDADEMPLSDSAASWGLKNLTWANLKDTIWTAWGALIAAGTSKATPVDADSIALSDSAASNATKKLTWANLKATLYASPTFTGTVAAPKFYASADADATTGFDLFSASPGSYGLFRNSTSVHLKTGSLIDLMVSTSAVLRISSTAVTAFQKIDLSSGQIKFPATQSASSDANTLDDYEKGTFTPVLQFGGATTGIAYTVQSGVYTKIGRMVRFRITIQLSSKGSATGTALITGLPFTSLTGTGYYAAEIVVSNMASITAKVSSYQTDNSTTLNLAQGTNTLAVLTDANFNNNALLMIAGAYFV